MHLREQPTQIAGPQSTALPVLLVFCAYVMVWYLQLGERVSVLGAIRLEFLMALPLILLAVFRTPRFNPPPLLLQIGLYFGVLVMQLALSHDIHTSWDVFYNRIIKFAFLMVFVIAFVRSPRDLALFLGAFLLACLKMGQEGLLGVINGSLMWENQGVMRLHGTTSLYTHPNSFSGMAIGTLPFIFLLFPISPWLVRAGLIALAVFSGSIILFTGSRTGYLGFVCFLLLLFARSRSKIRTILIALPIVALGAGLIPQDYRERFVSIFTMKEKEGNSAETRVQILKDAWDVFSRYPMGVGIAAFPAVRSRMFGRAQDTHNLYLEVATNLGVHGLAVFAMLIVTLLMTMRRLSRECGEVLEVLSVYEARAGDNAVLQAEIARQTRAVRLVNATTSATSIFVILRLVLGMFGMDMYEIYWWFATGLAVAMYNMWPAMRDAAYGLGKLVPASLVERSSGAGKLRTL